MDKFTTNDLATGEIAKKGITITKNSGTLDVTSATYTVYDESFNVVTAESDATISGDDVYADVSAGTDLGARIMIIKAFDDPYVIKARLDYNIEKG